MVEKLFGKKVASKVGKIWNFDNKKQELNNMFVKNKSARIVVHCMVVLLNVE